MLAYLDDWSTDRLVPEVAMAEKLSTGHKVIHNLEIL